MWLIKVFSFVLRLIELGAIFEAWNCTLSNRYECS